MGDLEEGRDAGVDLGEVGEQHDEAAREARLLPAALGHDVHGGHDGAERHEAGRERAVLAEVDERVRRRSPVPSSPPADASSRSSAGSARSARAERARRPSASPVSPARCPPPRRAPDRKTDGEREREHGSERSRTATKPWGIKGGSERTFGWGEERKPRSSSSSSAMAAAAAARGEEVLWGSASLQVRKHAT